MRVADLARTGRGHLLRDAERRRDVVARVDALAHRDAPVKLAGNVRDFRRRLLKQTIRAALVGNVLAVVEHLARTQRRDEAPVIVAVHEPAIALGLVVEQIFGPVVLDVELHRALHEAGDDVFVALAVTVNNRSFAAQRDGRLDAMFEHREALQLPGGDVETGAAIRTPDALRLIGRAQLERASAVRTVERRCRDARATHFAFDRDAELREGRLFSLENDRRLFAVVDGGE